MKYCVQHRRDSYDVYDGAFLGPSYSRIVFVVQAVSGQNIRSRFEQKDDALEILKERYARGEIDAAEYEEKRRQLAS